MTSGSIAAQAALPIATANILTPDYDKKTARYVRCGAVSVTMKGDLTT